MRAVGGGVIEEFVWVSEVPGRRRLHGIGRVTGLGKSKRTQKIPQMGRRYAVGWSARLLKTGDPSDVVIVVVVVVVWFFF